MTPDDLFRHKGRYRVDPNTLYPPFRERLFVVLQACIDRGAHYYATKGNRSYYEQARLYKAYQDKKAGRPVAPGFTGSRAAPAGYSAHQWGGAVDFAPDADIDKPGLQANYSLANYAILIEECERHGLVNGHTFRDAPHVQIPMFVSGKSMAPLRSIWVKNAKGPTETMKIENGMKAVWKYFDEKGVL
jgi:hypothetical protein